MVSVAPQATFWCAYEPPRTAPLRSAMASMVGIMLVGVHITRVARFHGKNLRSSAAAGAARVSDPGMMIDRVGGSRDIVPAEDTHRDPGDAHQGRAEYGVSAAGVECREADPVKDGDGESNEYQCLPFHDLSVPTTGR